MRLQEKKVGAEAFLHVNTRGESDCRVKCTFARSYIFTFSTENIAHAQVEEHMDRMLIRRRREYGGKKGTAKIDSHPVYPSIDGA